MRMKKVFFTFVLTFLLTFSVIGTAPSISNVAAEPDLPVYDAVFQKGMSYRHYPYPYDSAESNESLARMVAVGVEYVALTVWWCQQNISSTEIYRKEGWTATDEELVCAIDKIHQLGMNVMLKPMVDSELVLEYPDEEWRGNINGTEEWFDSYRNITNHYAEFAEANAVDLFCIGCEFKGTISKMEEWEKVIREIREHNYTGPITYAAIWDTCRSIEWWDSLDYVGIDAYFPLTEGYDPTLEELKQAWSLCAEDIESWHLTINKPIIFTEIGYRSGNGTNIVPWDWQTNMTIDLQEQVDCYEAAFQVLWNKPWFYGFYWWIWESDPEVGGPSNNDFTPQNKPVQYLITSWYSCQRPTLNVQYEELLAKYNILNTTYYELLFNYTELQSDYDSLQANYNLLNFTYNILKSQQEATIGELNNIRTLLYIFIATTIILIMATIYLATKIKVINASKTKA